MTCIAAATVAAASSVIRIAVDLRDEAYPAWCVLTAPLERDRVISFDKLINEIAAGRRDDDAVATLAARLAALDRRIGGKEHGCPDCSRN